jgi:acetylornithine deacetylase/succinyl-diaminopimelate desuccinylase-like protein
MNAYQQIDAWVDAHFDEQVRFLQALVQVPTDTPPGNNAPHAERTAELLAAMGLVAEQHPVPAAEVHAHGLQSITNLIVRRRFGEDGPTVALNAHGDVVPPGEGWTHEPYGGEVVDGKLYGRAAAVNKSDFATYTFALRALLAVAAPPPGEDVPVVPLRSELATLAPLRGKESPSAPLRGKDSPLAPLRGKELPLAPLRGTVELHFTYDEEFGGELGPGWLLAQGLTRPDLLIAAGFSYQVVTAHNGCLQLEVTLHGLASHAAYPDTGVDALQAANRLLSALYAHNDVLRRRRSAVPGISHPYLNVGRIEGGSHTNVVPGRVLLKMDRRMIPEEDPAAVEAELRALIEAEVALCPGVRIEITRLLLARALQPLPGHERLAQTLQHHARAVFGLPIPTSGTPLYTDVRLYGERGVPAVIYGAGPRTVLESNAKRADEHLLLADLRGATRVVARSLFDLLRA